MQIISDSVCYCDIKSKSKKDKDGIICSSDGKNFQAGGFCPETQACFGPTKEDPFGHAFPFNQKHQMCVDFNWKGNHLQLVNMSLIIWSYFQFQ